jgi:hypothetical protein
LGCTQQQDFSILFAAFLQQLMGQRLRTVEEDQDFFAVLELELSPLFPHRKVWGLRVLF